MVNTLSGVNEGLSWPEKTVDGGKPQEVCQLAWVEVSSLVLPSQVSRLLISIWSRWCSLLLLAGDETKEEQGRQIQVYSLGWAAICIHFPLPLSLLQTWRFSHEEVHFCLIWEGVSSHDLVALQINLAHLPDSDLMKSCLMACAVIAGNR